MSVASVSTAYSFPTYTTTTAASRKQRPESQLSTSNAGRTRVLKFSGAALAQTGKNGLWPVVECPPVGGGVAGVTASVPDAMARYTDKDMRVISPYYLPMAEEDEKIKKSGKTVLEFKKPDGTVDQYPLDYEDTDVTVTLPVYDNRGRRQDETFRLLQRFLPVLDDQGNPIPREDDPDTPKGHWRYFVGHPWFERFKKPYMYDATLPPGITGEIDSDPTRALRKTHALFVKAVTAFKPYLEGQAELPPGSKLRPFKSGVDFIIAQDAHTGPLWSELHDKFKTANIFEFHNHYDNALDAGLVEELSMRVPESLALKHYKTGKPLEFTHPYSQNIAYKLANGYYPSIVAGVTGADYVVGDRNYLRRLEDLLGEKHPLVVALKEKFEQNRVGNMHHTLPGNMYDPFSAPQLKAEEGFVHLKEISDQAILDYKNTNKLALQKQFGLAEGTDYILYANAGRIDPYQKGSYMMMAEAERFLKSPGHEKAQMIFSFTDGPDNARAVEWAKEIEQDPELKGRIKIFMGKFLPLAPVYAGIDFFMIPSVYEPYGQTQLEAYAMVANPIGHGVDGVKSTVSDPEMLARGLMPEDPPEKVWEYGQTGILMEPYDSIAYQKAIAYEDAKLSAYAKLAKGDIGSLGGAEVGALMLPLTPEGRQTLEKFEATLQHAQNSFRTAMDRAYELAQDPEKLAKVRMNGLKYFRTEHSPQAILARFYDTAIDKAVAIRNQRLQRMPVTPVAKPNGEAANDNQGPGQKLVAFA